MEPLFIQGTQNTPEFNFDVENLFIVLTGHSKISKTNDFYQKITKYITEIEKIRPIRLEIEFNLNTICRNSKRGILFLLMRIKEIQMNINTEVKINWLYKPNNELVKAIGEDLEYMVMIPIHLKPIKKDSSPALELEESF
ncbi:MAG: hypothetical protein CMP67_11265 [Flavobacteriales bacterium]|nr:hypothetical protein [Flavobacteriales bacterium]|tara:strand:- start:650 stop:1069 length:420 start_codon:yes stop_codon:yes gene_type:complete